jgi:hypothetical protein
LPRLLHNILHTSCGSTSLVALWHHAASNIYSKYLRVHNQSSQFGGGRISLTCALHPATITGSPKVRLRVAQIHVSSCGNHRAYLSRGVGRKTDVLIDRGAERRYRASEGVAGRCGHPRGVVGIHGALLRPAAQLMSTLELESSIVITCFARIVDVARFNSWKAYQASSGRTPCGNLQTENRRLFNI